MEATRKEVYAALDSERDYQQERWGPTETKGLHSISEFLLYMQDYLNEAAHIVSREGKRTAYPKALEVVRKITAMGVSCMEQHGAPRRIDLSCHQCVNPMLKGLHTCGRKGG